MFLTKFLILKIIDFAYSIAALCGIWEVFGWYWALAALFLDKIFSVTIFTTIGCFMCANFLWHFHWFPSIIFALSPYLVGFIFIRWIYFSDLDDSGRY